MAQLRGCLVRESLKLVEGSTEVGEAGKELERRYGSKDLAVVTTKRKLLSLQLRLTTYKQVEGLVQTVRTSRTTLWAHNTEDQLFGDYSIIGLLVAKLLAAVQDRWNFQVATWWTKDPKEKGGAF